MSSEVVSPMATASADDVSSVSTNLENNKTKNDDECFDSTFVFVMAAVGVAAGVGNIWRFPYVAFQAGGGSFFLCYWLTLLCIGYPILLMEMGLGHLFQCNFIGVTGNLHRRAKGVGLGASLLAFFVLCYYQVLVAVIVLYVLSIFRSHLPWVPTTEQEQFCSAILTDKVQCEANKICAFVDNTCAVSKLGVAANYLNTSVLGEAVDVGEGAPSTLVWPIVVAVLFCSLVSYGSLFHGPKVLGTISVITVVAPVCMLTFLVIQAGMLPGASTGLYSYIGDWNLSKMADPNVWTSSISQNFFSMGICQAVMIVYASHSKKAAPVFSGSVIATANHLIEFMAGFAVFSVTGSLASSLNVPLADLPLESLKLVFVAYPVGLSSLPWGVMHAVTLIFFLVLFLLGISSSFSFLETLARSLMDSPRFESVPSSLILAIGAVISVIGSMLYCTDLGMSYLDGVDYYVTHYGAITIGLVQTLLIGWFSATHAQAHFVGEQSVLLLQLAYVGSMAFGGFSQFFLKLGVFRNIFNEGIVNMILTTTWSLAAGFAIGGIFFASHMAIDYAAEHHNMSKFDALWHLFLGNVEAVRGAINEPIAIYAEELKQQAQGEKASEQDMPHESDEIAKRSENDAVDTTSTHALSTSTSANLLSQSSSSESNNSDNTASGELSFMQKRLTMRLPLLWSCFVKFIIPPAFIMLLVVEAPNFGHYNDLPMSIQLTGMGFLAALLLMIVVPAIFPDLFDVCMPSMKYSKPSCQRIIYQAAEAHIRSFDREKSASIVVKAEDGQYESPRFSASIDNVIVVNDAPVVEIESIDSYVSDENVMAN